VHAARRREAGVTHVIEQSQFAAECKIGSMSIESQALKAQSALIQSLEDKLAFARAVLQTPGLRFQESRAEAYLALEDMRDLVPGVADQRKAVERVVAAEELQALLGVQNG
jgi:hypothetical protein